MTDRPRRPGTMTDDDRALIGRDRRRASSEPAADAFDTDDDHFTPVGRIIERIEADLGDELSPRERRIALAFGRHTANMELRARKRSDSQDTALLRREIDDLQLAIVDIRGESGSNGKLGALKERVDKAEARKWWGVTFLAGLAVTVISAAIAFGSWMGSIETDVETLKQRTFRARNVSPPDFPATKEGPTP